MVKPYIIIPKAESLKDPQTYSPSGVRELNTLMREAGVKGFRGPLEPEIRIIDLTDEAARTAEQLEDHHAVDGTISFELIKPRGSAESRKKISDEDLWHLDAIGLLDARQRGFRGRGEGITVVVVDTGIDASHEELRDNEGLSKVVAAHEMKSVGNSWQVTARQNGGDSHGHGTHVAGLIAGNRVGVAPGAKLWDLALFREGHVTLDQFVEAMYWLRKQEVHVVNISGGVFTRNVPQRYTEGMLALIDWLAEKMLVVATGNEGKGGKGKARWPARAEDPVSVGAVDRNGDVWGGSSSEQVYAGVRVVYSVPDIVAPGVDITSAKPGGGYIVHSGTSMATAIVSGIAALLYERYPTLPVAKAISSLKNACTGGSAEDFRRGLGLINLSQEITG